LLHRALREVGHDFLYTFLLIEKYKKWALWKFKIETEREVE